MKLRRILWLCLLLTSTLWHAWADIIPAGQRGVNYCCRIDNIDQYPNYVFIAYCRFPSPGYSIIKPGECIRFYHLCQPSIYAIAKAKFSEDSIKNDRFENSEESRLKLQRYFEANPNMVRSGIEIRSVSTRDKSDPVKSIEDILTIKSVPTRTLSIEYQSVIYTFDNGTIEKKAYTTQSKRPAPSSKIVKTKSASSHLPGTMWLVAGSLSVIGLLLSRYIRNRTH